MLPDGKKKKKKRNVTKFIQNLVFRMYREKIGCHGHWICITRKLMNKPTMVIILLKLPIVQIVVPTIDHNLSITPLSITQKECFETRKPVFGCSYEIINR